MSAEKGPPRGEAVDRLILRVLADVHGGGSPAVHAVVEPSYIADLGAGRANDRPAVVGVVIHCD
jgi:hypothetical protein